MTAQPRLLLFTDLDGTLLDHYSYTSEPAREALQKIKAHNIPLIFSTSKTLAESRDIQQSLGLSGPLIVENGAGVALPSQDWPAEQGEPVLDGDYRLISFAPSYQAVRDVLEQLRRQHGYDFTGFGDMSTAQITEATGLPYDAAARAQARAFDEPIIWHDSTTALEEFFDHITSRELLYTRGGRFIHVMGPTDKGAAMLWLANQYGLPQPRLIALGDSDNDINMLSQADVAVLVRSPVHDLPQLPADQRPPVCIVTEETGPAGWNRAVLDLLEELVSG